jgi:hypothetical protein
MNVQKIIDEQKKIYKDLLVVDLNDSMYQKVIDGLESVSIIAKASVMHDETKKILYHIVGHENAPIFCVILLDIHGSVELCIDAFLKAESSVSCSILYTICGSGSLKINASFVHEAINSKSVFLAKGIVIDQAKSHVMVKTVVTKEAVNSDALQTIHHLMLSDRANVTAMPILEALTDQIACKHGSSIGSYDSEALFFLQSRGFDTDQAQLILTEAFFN